MGRADHVERNHDGSGCLTGRVRTKASASRGDEDSCTHVWRQLARVVSFAWKVHVVVGALCSDVTSHRPLRRDMDKRRGLRERMTKGSGAANGGSTATGSSEEDVDGQRRRSTKCAVDFSRLDVATLRKYRRVNRLEDISNGTKEQLLPGIIQHFGSQVRPTVDVRGWRTCETRWMARVRVWMARSFVSFLICVGMATVGVRRVGSFFLGADVSSFFFLRLLRVPFGWSGTPSVSFLLFVSFFQDVDEQDILLAFAFALRKQRLSSMYVADAPPPKRTRGGRPRVHK